MDASRFDDRMSDSDALMWNIERDPILRSTILSIWILDRPPDRDRLAAKLRSTLQVIPRLRQRVVADPLGVAPPRWQTAPDFNPEYHVRVSGAPGKGTLRDVLDVGAPVVMQAFDRDRPLWEMVLVEGLEGGRAAVLLKIHHAMSDGVGLVRMTAGLIETSREPEPGEEPEAISPDPVPEPWNPVDETLDALRYRATQRIQQGRSAAGAVLQGLGRLVRSPRDAVTGAAEVATSAARLLAPISEPLSPLMRGRSMGLRLDSLARPFADLKRAGRAVDGTVNDAFVAAVAGGLQRYHRAHGHEVGALRMTLPINLRHGEKGRRAGNQFAPARFAVPVGIEDPRVRMREIHRLVEAERNEPSLPALDVIAGALNRLPGAAQVAAFGGMLKAVDFVCSNVPGPRFPVYLAGARVEEMIPFGPPSGSAVNLTLFSYDGEVRIGINSDTAAVAAPDLLVACLEEGFDEVLAVG